MVSEGEGEYKPSHMAPLMGFVWGSTSCGGGATPLFEEECPECNWKKGGGGLTVSLKEVQLLCGVVRQAGISSGIV